MDITVWTKGNTTVTIGKRSMEGESTKKGDAMHLKPYTIVIIINTGDFYSV